MKDFWDRSDKQGVGKAQLQIMWRSQVRTDVSSRKHNLYIVCMSSFWACNVTMGIGRQSVKWSVITTEMVSGVFHGNGLETLEFVAMIQKGFRRSNVQPFKTRTWTSGENKRTLGRPHSN